MRALVRPPSEAYARCLRSDVSRTIDVARARAQHAAYCEALRACGLEIVALAPEPDLPDACFVEDAAVVVRRRAVITRPGAPSRRGETASVERALADTHEIRRVERGFVDGGDVLVGDGVAFVGLSSRTDAEGAHELERALEMEVRTVPVGGALHLKSVMTTLVRLRGTPALPGVGTIETDEPLGANVLAVGGHAVVSAAAPRTAELLRRRGRAVHAVELGEFHAGDAGVTCLSVLLRE